MIISTVCLSTNSYFMIGPLGALTLAMGVSLFYAWRDARLRPPRRRTRLYQCRECRQVYEDRRNVPLATCPQCGAFNEAVRR